MRLQQLFFKRQLPKQEKVIVRSASATPVFYKHREIYLPDPKNLTIAALAFTARIPLVAV